MIKKIGIIGAGQMGSGIAQTSAQSGFEVYLSDQSQEFAEKGKARIAAQLKKLVEKGKMGEGEVQQILGAIHPVGGLQDLASADLVIEAIAENPELKFSTFKKLDEICAPHAILASNTSSISITAIAAKTRRPTQVAGMHFMNPVPVMKLVEGIRGLQTSDETFKAVRAVAEKMGKTFVEAKDQPGSRREPNPHAHDQRSGHHASRRRGFGRGHRRRDDPRHESTDGPF